MTNDLCFLLLLHFLVDFSDAGLADVVSVCYARGAASASRTSRLGEAEGSGGCSVV